jgi:hypothetical protein
MSNISPASTSGVAGQRSSGARVTETERSSAASLLRLIWGIHISRCVYAVAELGIADLLADGAVSTRQLANAPAPMSPPCTGCFASSQRWTYSRSTRAARSA